MRMQELLGLGYSLGLLSCYYFKSYHASCHNFSGEVFVGFFAADYVFLLRKQMHFCMYNRLRSGTSDLGSKLLENQL